MTPVQEWALGLRPEGEEGRFTFFPLRLFHDDTCVASRVPFLLHQDVVITRDICLGVPIKIAKHLDFKVPTFVLPDNKFCTLSSHISGLTHSNGSGQCSTLNGVWDSLKAVYAFVASKQLGPMVGIGASYPTAMDAAAWVLPKSTSHVIKSYGLIPWLGAGFQAYEGADPIYYYGFDSIDDAVATKLRAKHTVEITSLDRFS